MNIKTVSTCIKITLPVMCGYIPLGIAFGLYMTNAGYPWWFLPLFSIIIYSGAAQFMAVSLFAANAPLSSILFTIALISIRHSFYSFSLITKFKNTGRWKPYLIFAETDETFSLISTTRIPEGISKGNYYGLLTLLDQSYWVIGGLLGVFLGAIIPFDMNGIDFSLTALFAVMTVEQILATKDFRTIIISAFCTIAAIILCRLGYLGDSGNILLVAFAAALTEILIFKKRPSTDTAADTDTDTKISAEIKSESWADRKTAAETNNQTGEKNDSTSSSNE